MNKITISVLAFLAFGSVYANRATEQLANTNETLQDCVSVVNKAYEVTQDEGIRDCVKNPNITASQKASVFLAVGVASLLHGDVEKNCSADNVNSTIAAANDAINAVEICSK